MIKSLLAACALTLIVAGCSIATGDEANVKAVSNSAQSTAQAPAPAKITKSDGGGLPSEIIFQSAVGEVLFQHQKHIADRSINCVECHHQINAKKLNTPHADYLASSSVKCQVCHKDSDTAVYSCSQCHDAKRKDIADETLSSKVVIHQQCRKCHDVGTGKDASNSCVLCHKRKARS